MNGVTPLGEIWEEFGLYTSIDYSCFPSDDSSLKHFPMTRKTYFGFHFSLG